MNKNKNTLIALLSLVLLLLLGVTVYLVFIKGSKQEIARNTDAIANGTTTGTKPSNCRVERSPSGDIASVCSLVSDTSIPYDALTDPSVVLSDSGTQILSAGEGTTTLKKATPFNDILIAETGSQYATLRNARYIVWPFPGTLAFKEVYLVLPDTYEPLFPGYSNGQYIVSDDGTKHIMLYLRHKESTSMGADTTIFIQSPIETDEADHPLERIDTNPSGVAYSIVVNHQEAIVEVSFVSATISSEVVLASRFTLLELIEQMEIIW